MVHSYVEGPPADTLRKRCPLTLALLVALVAGGCVELLAAAHASAAIVSISPHPGHGTSIQSFGNGKFNKNSLLVNSAISDRAVLGIRNANSGGKAINIQATCKWKLRCKFNQRAVLFNP